MITKHGHTLTISNHPLITKTETPLVGYISVYVRKLLPILNLNRKLCKIMCTAGFFGKQLLYYLSGGRFAL